MNRSFGVSVQLFSSRVTIGPNLGKQEHRERDRRETLAATGARSGISGLVVRIRSLAATVGAVATASRWRFPSLQHIPDRLGFLSVGQMRRSLDYLPLTPTFSFYMCAARRGPTSLPRAGRPRSGRESRPLWSVGPKRWRSTLTFSPLISSRILTHLNLYFLHS